MVQSPQKRQGTEEQSMYNIFDSLAMKRPGTEEHTQPHPIETQFTTSVLTVSQNDNPLQGKHENIKSQKFQYSKEQLLEMSSQKRYLKPDVLFTLEDNNIQENGPPSENLKNTVSKDLLQVPRPIDFPSSPLRKSRNRGAVDPDNIRYRLAALISPPRQSIRTPFTFNKTPKKSAHTPKQWTISPRNAITTPRKSPRRLIIAPRLSPRISITPPARDLDISHDRRPDQANISSPIRKIRDEMDSMHILPRSERRRTSLLYKPIPEGDEEIHANDRVKENSDGQSMWYYEDHDSNIRGPYTSEKMKFWFEEDYLPMNLKVYHGVDITKDTEFKFLALYFLEGDQAFLDHVPKICYDSKKDGKKHSQVDKSRYKTKQYATVKKTDSLFQHDPRQKQGRQHESEDREYSAQSQQNIFPQYQNFRHDRENIYPEYEIDNSENSGHQTRHPSASLTQFQQSANHPLKERLWTQSSSEALYDNSWLSMKGHVAHPDVRTRPHPQILSEWRENAQYPSVQGQVEPFPLYLQQGGEHSSQQRFQPQ